MKCTCRSCGNQFIIVGIFPRKDDFYCSIPCLRENMESQSEEGNKGFLLTAVEKNPTSPVPAIIDLRTALGAA